MAGCGVSRPSKGRCTRERIGCVENEGGSNRADQWVRSREIPAACKPSCGLNGEHYKLGLGLGAEFAVLSGNRLSVSGGQSAAVSAKSRPLGRSFHSEFARE
ncbi:MAG: hypothetical protein ACE5R6_17650 [Candidatus Heimdallarchaeota archaeon]